MIHLLSLLKSVVYRYCGWRFRRKVTFVSNNIGKIGPYAKVVFQDGSSRSDIILGSNCRIHGLLHSQSHGKIIIGDWVKIGRNVQIRSCQSVMIGDDTAIAANVIIQDNNTHPVSPQFRRIKSRTPESSEMQLWKWSSISPIVIGSNVWIGENARICKGVSIGDNSVIGANAIVTKDVPSNSIAVGNPARIVRSHIDSFVDKEELLAFLN